MDNTPHNEIVRAKLQSTSINNKDIKKDHRNDYKKDSNNDQVRAKPTKKGAVWLFSGFGSAWLDMGTELLAKEAVFRNTVIELDGILLDELGFSAFKALKNGEFDTEDTGQILILVMQIALAALLISKGAQPIAVIGHSVGEIAAAVIAGAITAKEGLLIACKYSQSYKELSGKGAKVSVNCPRFNNLSAFDLIDATLHGREDIGACLDLSPTECVVFGHQEAIEHFREQWEDGVDKLTAIETTMPFHRPLVHPLEQRLKETLAAIILNPKPPTVPIYSTSSLNPRATRLRDAVYWHNNTISPVRLTTAVKAAAEDGHRVFLEISPHPVISHFVKSTLSTILPPEESCVVLPTVIRNEKPLHALVCCMARMWRNGVQTEWRERFAGYSWVDMMGPLPEDSMKIVGKVGDWGMSDGLNAF